MGSRMAFQRKPVIVVDVAVAADCWMGTTRDQSVAEVMALVRASQALATLSSSGAVA